MIVGCGFGGPFAAKALGRADVEVTVVDPTNHHLFQPLLYQVATGILSEGDIAPPIRDVLRHQRNASVVLGEVVDVDLAPRRLAVDTLGRRSVISYDSLIVATGASQSPVERRAPRGRAGVTRVSRAVPGWGAERKPADDSTSRRTPSAAALGRCDTTCA